MTEANEAVMHGPFMACLTDLPPSVWMEQMDSGFCPRKQSHKLEPGVEGLCSHSRAGAGQPVARPAHQLGNSEAKK